MGKMIFVAAESLLQPTLSLEFSKSEWYKVTRG
jgi:hypothetical protein